MKAAEAAARKRLLRAKASRSRPQHRHPALDLTWVLQLRSANTISRQEIVDHGASLGLQIRKIPGLLGVGVFARDLFRKGSVMVRYAGETISVGEGHRRERQKGEVYVLLCRRLQQCWNIRAYMFCGARTANSFTCMYSFQDPRSPPGYVFFATGFAVDAGNGDHISHKINHSRRKANVKPTVCKTSQGEHCIVLQAMKVSRSCVLFKHAYD